MTATSAAFAPCSEMPSYSLLLNRADEYVLQGIVGQGIVRLLQNLDPDLSKPSSLRHLVLDMPSADIISDSQHRGLLIDLLKPQEAQHFCERLNLTTDDPYGALKSMRWKKGSRQEEIFYALLEEDAPTLEVVEASPALISVGPSYPLFEHQRVAVDECWKILNGPDERRVMLHMPTGSGKTRTAMHAICRFLVANEEGLILWLANSEELCEQAAEEFQKAWSSLGNRDVTLGRFWGDRNEDALVEKGVIVAGLGKLYEFATRKTDTFLERTQRIGLVVFDEAHQAIAPTYREILDVILNRNPQTGLLGLSATPGRSYDDIEKDEELADFFYRKKVTLGIAGYDSPIEFLISEGYLAQPTFDQLLVEGGYRVSERDMKQISEGFEIPGSILKELAEDDQRNLKIIVRLEQLMRRNKRIIVFAASVRHADELAAVLRARGHWARAVTGQTGSEQRSRALDDYKADAPEPRVLVNFGVLTTGFDAPKTSAAVIARPTQSLVLYSQMIGRALRGETVGGNVEAEIVTVVDDFLPGFRDPQEMFENWEDVW